MREGDFERLDGLKGYSKTLKNTVKIMLNRDPKLRPTADNLLSVLPNKLELELKWQKASNFLLKNKLKEYQRKMQKKSTKRKLSI